MSEQDVFKDHLAVFYLADDSGRLGECGTAESGTKSVLERSSAAVVFKRHNNLIDTDTAYRQEYDGYVALMRSSVLNWPFNKLAKSPNFFLTDVFAVVAEKVTSHIQSAALKYRTNRMARWYNNGP